MPDTGSLQLPMGQIFRSTAVFFRVAPLKGTGTETGKRKFLESL